MNFKVAGITSENEDRKDIQTLIDRDLKKQYKEGLIDEKYEGYTNSEIKEMDLNVPEFSNITYDVIVKEDTFNDEKCAKVYIKNYEGNLVHIGYIPKKQLKEYFNEKEIYNSNKNKSEITGTAELTGGKYKYCELYEEDYVEKERVEIKELSYGLNVTLFYNNKEDKKETVETVEQQNIQHTSTKKIEYLGREYNDIKSLKNYMFSLFFVGILLVVVGVFTLTIVIGFFLILLGIFYIYCAISAYNFIKEYKSNTKKEL